TIMLIFTEGKDYKPVPLQKVEVNAHVVDMIAEVNILQTYKNLEEKDIEAIYKFILSDTAAVCGFEATIDDKRKIIGIVKEAEQAKKEYKEAIKVFIHYNRNFINIASILKLLNLKQGYGAYLLEEQDSDTFKCSIGNIRPGQKVKIKIKYVIELQHDVEANSVRFILPATIAPKYGTHFFNHKRMRLSTEISDSSDYSPIEFSITCTMSSPINRIKSPSHPDHISIDYKDKEQGISQFTSKVKSNKENLYYLETDFILLIKSQNIDEPRAFIEYNPTTETHCLMLTLVPSFKHNDKSTKHNSTKMELIFIVDNSRSMKGASIEKVTKTLQYLLISLPKSCFFNVITIGHKQFFSYFTKSQPCTNTNIEEVIKKIQKITANGGTHLYEALKWAFNHSLPDKPTSIILFSDFETSNINRIVDLIKNPEMKKDLRIFSIGINNSNSNSNCHHFIDSIVRAGKGYAQYVSNSEEMNRKAIIMLRNSLNPPITDYKITWTNESNEESQDSDIKFQQAPLKIPELYVGVRFIVYCILAKDVKPCETITLKSKSHLLDLEPIKPISLHGSKIHTLAAKKLIQEIEYGNYYPNHANNEVYVREQIVRLAISYSLSSKYTSFIATEMQSIEDHEKKKDDGSSETGETICEEINVPVTEVVTTVKKDTQNIKFKSPESESWWKTTYDKAREYLSKQIGDKNAEEELIKCADEYVVDKVTDKVISEKKHDVIDLKKDEIPKTEKGKTFFGGLYDTAAKLADQLENTLSFDKIKLTDHEKAEAIVIIEEPATPEKCEEIISKQKDDGSIELDDSVCNELDTPKEEVITTIIKKTKNNKLKSPEHSPSLAASRTFIGVIRLELVSAKDLNIDPSVKGKFYVRIFDEDKEIIAQTNFVDDDFNPTWNEVHYFPVNKIGDKFFLDVMNYNTKDESLGTCHFEVTGDLIKESIDIWAKLSIEGQIHYRAKFFSLESLSQPTPESFANSKERSFNLSSLYFIITLQAPNGSFPPSNGLAKLFGYESPGKLLDLYISHCNEDRVLKINQTAWTTSMIMWFLQSILIEYRNEWLGVYKHATQYISKETHCDLEVEKILLSIGETVVNERLDINVK
ncbi:22368_t:CDS:2, partial [Dentiscutata erythropus]